MPITKSEEVEFDFEKLDAYRMARDASVKLIGILDRFPRRYGWLLDQMRRSSYSVPLNIAEGNGREGTRDKIQFFRIAQGSLNESVAGVDIAYRLGIIPEQKRNEVRSMLYRVTRMLGGLTRSLKKGQKK